MRRPHARISRVFPAWIEPLEPRQMLSGNGVIDVDQGLPDLAVVFADNMKLPTEYLSGGGQTINVALRVSNEDTAGPDQVALPLAKDQTVDISLVARPADGGPDVEIAVIEGVNVGNLKPGQSRKVSTQITLPSELTSQDYTLVAHVDPLNKVLELNEDQAAVVPQENNIAVSDPIAVTQGLPDLIVTIPSSKTLPATTQSASGQVYKLPIRITNMGNLAVGDEQMVSVAVVLESVDGSDSEMIQMLDNIDVSKLRPGQSTNTSALVYFYNAVNDLPFSNTDTQQFTATVDPNNSVAELDEENNAGSSDAVTVEFGAPTLVVDFAPNQPVPKKPVVSGDGTTIKATVQMYSVGDVAFDPARTEPTMVALYARPVGAADESQDVQLTDEVASLTKKLNVGRSRSLKLEAELTESLPDGTYNLVVRQRYTVATGEEQKEYDRYDKTPLVVVGGFRDPSLTLGGAVKLPAEALAGDGKPINLPVVITNLGNLPIDADTLASIDVVARPADRADDPTADIDVQSFTDIDLSNFGPGKSKKLNLRVTLPAGLKGDDGQPVGDFVLVATLTDAGDDADATNNAVATDALAIAEGNPDLTVSIADAMKPIGQALTGDGTNYRLPLLVTNLGNLATAKDQLVEIKIAARSTTGGNDVPLADITDVKLGRVSPAKAKTLNTTFQLPKELVDGDYELVVKVDTANDVPELDETNNTSDPAGGFSAVQGLPDLTLTLVDAPMDGQDMLSGDGQSHKVAVEIGNAGIIGTDKDTPVKVRLTAVSGEGEDQLDTEIAYFEDIMLGNLTPGRSKRLNLSFELPQTLATGTYTLRAEVDPANEVLEQGEEAGNGANNSATGPTLNVTQGGADLAVSFDDALDLPATAVSGDGTPIPLPIVLTNLGNLAVAKDQPVSLSIMAHLQANGDDTTGDFELMMMDDMSMGALAPGKSTQARVTVELPASLEPGTYVLVAHVNDNENLTELDLTNNTAATGPMGVGV
jgi:CARDB